MKDLYFPTIGIIDPALQQELLRVGAAISEAGNIAFEQLSAEPEFPVPFHAVATNPPHWDPLARGGTDPYIVWYNPNVGWEQIGSGGVTDLSDYYTKDEVDALLDGKMNNGALDGTLGEIGVIIDQLTEGLEANTDSISNLEADVDIVEQLVADHSESINDLTAVFGDTASAAASAAAAAASQAAAALAEANAIIAQAGAEAARDEAVIAKVDAQSAQTAAGNSANSAASSALSAASAASDAAAAAIASEASRIEAEAAANTAVNAAQGGVTIDAAAGALFTFNNDAEGWVGTDPGETWDAAGFISQGTGSNPVLTSPAISVNGNGYREVVARIRRTAGSGWEGRIRYSTSGHGFSGSYEVVLPDPFLVNGEWQVVTWDFNSVSDWTSSTITGLEVQLGSDGGDGAYDIDWIGVGNNIASLAAAAATHANSAAASASNAANSAVAANSSAVSASSSAAGAAGSAAAAAVSASTAETHATNAAVSASAAQSERIAAESARSGAEAAETNAVTAKNDAEGAAAAAASSASNAANSQAAAAGSASAAAISASQASTSAINAATSASAALASEVAANTSSVNAANSASAAAISASDAEASSTAAAGHASAASGSATQAATSASNASTAAMQASNASTAAANASQSASTSAQQAASSAATATTQASNATSASASAAQSAALAAQVVQRVAAVNPLNVVGDANGWAPAGSGSIDTVLINLGGRNIAAGRLRSTGDSQFLSDPFDIDPTGIYEVRISVLKTHSLGFIYMGIYGVPVTNVRGIHEQVAGGTTTNPYWVRVNSPPANQWYDFVFYLCGSAVDPAKVPDGIVANAVNVSLLNGHGLQTLEANNRVRLRILNWGNNGTQTDVYATNIFVSRYDNKSSVEWKQEVAARAQADANQVSQINSLSSTLNGHTASITSLNQILNGMSARYTLTLNANGQVAGMEIATGGGQQSSIVFLSDRFAIARPNGSGVTFPFTVGSVNGVSTIGINGNLVVDGTIVARSLASGSIGTICQSISQSLPTNPTSGGTVMIPVPAGSSTNGIRSVFIFLDYHFGQTGFHTSNPGGFSVQFLLEQESSPGSGVWTQRSVINVVRPACMVSTGQYYASITFSRRYAPVVTNAATMLRIRPVSILSPYWNTPGAVNSDSSISVLAIVYNGIN